MVGGGCRGLRLARTLVAEGHAVRAVTRTPARRARDRGGGLRVLDRRPRPHRVAALRAGQRHRPAVAARARRRGPNVEALHGSRLRMMLDKMTDTTVRGVVYEAAGTVEPAVLEAGAAELALAQTLNEIPARCSRPIRATPTPGWRGRARPSNTF